MSLDLCHGCHISEYSNYHDEAWSRKYIDMHWKEEAGVVFFWHEYEENGYFSNWYASPFVIDDFRYQHVEQYLMAQKAKLFHDTEMYTAILRANTPDECKKLGRRVMPFDADTWENARYGILKAGLSAKFGQNEKLKAALLATGNAILAEASPYDDIFGIKLSADAAKQSSPKNWPGRNLLGKALMEVRTELSGDADIAAILNSSTYYDINRILRNGESY